MKLSQRLEAAANVACNPLDVALYREAAALAKSVESAPVGVAEHNLGCVLMVRAANNQWMRGFYGQRVALVPLPQ